MDAARPVDAQTAPTGLWKTADGFPQRPQPVIVFLVQERSRARNGLTGGRQSRFLRFLATADSHGSKPQKTALRWGGQSLITGVLSPSRPC